MKNLRTRGLVAAVVAGALVLSACSSPSSGDEASGDVVKIGLVVHRTGPYASNGAIQIEGAEAAVKAINADGGIEALGGAKIKLIIEDAGATVDTAISAANRAISEGIVAGIGTDVSSSTLAVTEVAQRAKVPWITLAYDDAITERGFNYVFDTSPKTSVFTDFWTKNINELAAESDLKITRVGIISGENINQKTTADLLRNTYAKKYGWDIVIDETYKEGSLTDATPIVNQIKEKQPQLLLLGSGVPDIAKITNTERQMGMTPVPWVLSGAGVFVNGAFLDALGEDGPNGSFAITTSAPFASEPSASIVKELRAAGNDYPQQFDIVEYSTMYIIKEAIEKAKSLDRDKVRDALAATDIKGGPGAAAWPAQSVTFDKTGRAVDPGTVLVQWQGDQTKTVFPVDLAEAEPIWPTF